jgi:hypothetical protein
MPKPAKKQPTATSASSVAAAKPSQQAAADPKTKKAETDSKQARVITMLRSPAGATLAAIMKATGWRQHSVRGFLAGAVRKRLKLKLGSSKVDGNRVYRITSADGGKPTSRQSKHRSA